MYHEVDPNTGVAEEFVRFMDQFVTRQNVSLTFLGTAAVSAFGVELGDIVVDVESEIQAMDGFRSQVFSLDLPGDHADGGIEMNVDLDLINPAVGGISSDIGSIFFDLFYKVYFAAPPLPDLPFLSPPIYAPISLPASQIVASLPRRTI